MTKRSILRFKRVRVIMTLGLLVGIGGVATAASFTDYGNLNLNDSGIGSTDRFDIGLIRNGGVIQADTADGVAWPIGGTGQDMLLPGHQLETEIPVFNNTAGLAAEVTLAVEALDNGTAGAKTDPAALYRLSAFDTASGAVLFGNPSDPDNGLALSAVGNIDLGTFTARGSVALNEGSTWVAGQAGSDRTITVIIAYPESTQSEQFNGGQSRLMVRFMASSTS